jgi:hypothetical protein
VGLRWGSGGALVGSDGVGVYNFCLATKHYLTEA